VFATEANGRASERAELPLEFDLAVLVVEGHVFELAQHILANQDVDTFDHPALHQSLGLHVKSFGKGQGHLPLMNAHSTITGGHLDNWALGLHHPVGNDCVSCSTVDEAGIRALYTVDLARDPHHAMLKFNGHLRCRHYASILGAADLWDQGHTAQEKSSGNSARDKADTDRFPSVFQTGSEISRHERLA